MASRFFSVALPLAALAAILLVAPVRGQHHPTVPSDRYHSVRSQESVPVQQMPPVDTAAFGAEQTSADRPIGPYRYGTVLDTELTPERHGLWERLPSGDWLWRLRLHSDDAVSLSVSFTRFRLPDGASMYLHGPEGAHVRGPYDANDATDGGHRTPIVEGSEVVVELQVPDRQRESVQLEIGQVVHGFRSIIPAGEQKPSSKAGACNVDVACEEADPWRKQVQSIGLYSFENAGFAFACTGALVNNTAEDRTPYFLTAEHCVPSPEVASTMVFYWNYQHSTCRTRGTPENGQVTDDSATAQTSSGAILRARYGNTHDENTITGKPDLSLVEVDDDIPGSYNLYFSGWSRESQATRRGVTIHHPGGHGKRISFDDDSTAVTAYGETNGGNSHLRIGNWDLGTTEAGSSGAPLFNADQQIVGVLSGGFAGCETSGSAVDNDLPDWYGRAALGFQHGDFMGTTFDDLLDPLNTGTDTLGGLAQSPGADFIAPGRIRNFHVLRVNTAAREVTLRWTASGDDRYRGRADRYELHVDTTRIETETDFQAAQRIADVPTPAEAGQSETVTVGADLLQPNRTYYFALVAADETGNRSPRATTQEEVVLTQGIEIGEGGVTTGMGRSVAQTQFVLNETQDVRIALYDLLGRRVRVVLDERIEEGFQRTVQFETSSLSSGPYFLRFVGETFATTRKFVVVH